MRRRGAHGAPAGLRGQLAKASGGCKAGNRPGWDRYYADRYYRDGRYYGERRWSSNDRIYLGSDGRYYCRRTDGTTGLIIGGAVGALLGNAIDNGRSSLLGTLIASIRSRAIRFGRKDRDADLQRGAHGWWERSVPMTYRISGLDAEPFAQLFGRDDAALAQAGACRVTANAKPGFPCRISLEDAEIGDSLILLNHVSHETETPYRSSYAIYVREDALPAQFVDRLPPVFAGRPLGLRGFDAEGMLCGALLAMPGEADAKIRLLFDRPEIATIHAHNAAHGCFVAKVERD